MRNFVWLLLVASVAFADIVIDDPCFSMKVGDPCAASRGRGVCTPAKCSRNDYSEGIPPKQKVVDCLKCLPAKPGAGVPASKKKDTK